MLLITTVVIRSNFLFREYERNIRHNNFRFYLGRLNATFARINYIFTDGLLNVKMVVCLFILENSCLQ